MGGSTKKVIGIKRERFLVKWVGTRNETEESKRRKQRDPLRSERRNEIKITAVVDSNVRIQRVEQISE